ncbi:MAG: methylamine methyltransferase corrinoid protein reductive activase [Candidatus Methanogranum gryphiswaldense]|nr:MAG: methylamine methyltransferase corrinoid protein reductive activase [Candidatus Methanogranum sp. U3.2.1]
MTDYCIALDIGTSGLRCQAIDMGTGETLATSITQRHPIPGMNVIDHVNFAIQSGEDVANGLIIGAVNQLFSTLGIDLSKVRRVGVSGNTFQLSLFENIEIRDLAYAGKNMLKDLGVVPPERNGKVLKASDLGIVGMPDAELVIPPAVTHEIGADAIAMLKMTNILSEKEPVIVVDYGTNAEMALIVNGKIFTGSAAAGPALEGQQIEKGMLAAPGAICDVDITKDGWKCTVLDDAMVERIGDTVDPKTGKPVEKGKMNCRAIGVTGTGVVATLYCGMETGLIDTPKILTPDGKIHLQDDICISSADVDEAGKAIGALRAGFLTLLHEAGLWTGDVKKAYMSGASGLYVDAAKAMKIGMVVPGAEHIVQFGNTSIEMAREIAMGKMDLDDLREFAKKLRATHVMFATSETFKNIYSIEYSLWCTGMPASEYNNMLDIYNLPPLSEPTKKLVVERLARTDLPDTENRKVNILEDSGTIIMGEVKDCTLCGHCIKACPENALSIIREEGKVYAKVKSDRCAGTACRRCERACKQGVLNLRYFTIPG